MREIAEKERAEAEEAGEEEMGEVKIGKLKKTILKYLGGNRGRRQRLWHHRGRDGQPELEEQKGGKCDGGSGTAIKGLKIKKKNKKL